MKKIISILTLVFVLSMAFCVNVLAATNYPSLSPSKYCEFTAIKKMNVYVDTKLATQGTSIPYKKYSACISKNDVCYIYKITSSYAKVNYPTSAGRKTGYIKTSDLLGKNITPSSKFIANEKVTTYKYKNGISTGYYESGDTVYKLNGINYNMMYSAKSGKRAYKLAYESEDSKSKVLSKTVKIKGWCYDVYGRNAMQDYAKITLYSTDDKVLGTAKGNDGNFSLACSVQYPDSPSYIIIDTKVGRYKASGRYELTGTDISNIARSKEIHINCPVYIGVDY